MPRMDIGKLNDLYTHADSVDKTIFTEMRSNILLTSGDHYRKTSDRLWSRIKDAPANEPTKLRLVKNHVQKIVKTYVNSILNASPGVRVFPYNDSELQDQKTAEQNQSVWEDMKQVHKIKAKTRRWAGNFIDMGECATKIYWDPSKGTLMGYHQLIVDGEPKFSEAGNPQADKSKPKFSGDIVFEKLLPFNLLRDPAAETMEESSYLIVRKMVNIDIARKPYLEDEDKLAMIKKSGEQTFKVFDGQSGSYSMSKNEVMFREFYWRPSVDYPQGYFYITTDAGILAHGELPFGIFPVMWQGDEEIATSPRARSIIKHLRPYQAEINRAASSIATAQISLGDDRVYVMNGSKVSKGVQMPGIRVFNVTGSEPKITPGRSGEQYFQYLQAQISEMYQIANLAEITSEEKPSQAQDVYPLLFKSLKDKQRFSLKSEKFEEFLVGVAETALAIAKHYYPDEKFIRAAGRREGVNIAEFRASSPDDIRFKVEPVSEDIESTLGRALQLNHILQFVGSNLEEQSIAELISGMPFFNDTSLLSDLRLESENITSDILALDRGEWRPPGKYDGHKSYIKKLTHRIKQKDFGQLDPQIQEMFAEKLKMHEEAESQQVKDLQEAQAGFIPTGGGLSKADVYEPDPKSPEKQRRATYPVEALMWLKEQLNKQGMTQDAMASMQEQNLIEINQLMQQQGGGQAPQQELPPLPPQQLPIQGG